MDHKIASQGVNSARESKNAVEKDDYEAGFSIDALFRIFGIGVSTEDGDQTMDVEASVTEKALDNKHVLQWHYSVFDVRPINFNIKLEPARKKLMANFIDRENIGLLSLKGIKDDLSSQYGITKYMIHKSVLSAQDNTYVFPLYLYSDQQHGIQTTYRTPNLRLEIVNQMASQIGLKFTNEQEEESEGNASPVCYAQSPELREGFEIDLPARTFTPIDILDYVYAVLHAQSYREKHKKFLKTSFPRVPYPKDQKTFWQLVKLGGEIRRIHLLESAKVERFVTTYPVEGHNTIIWNITKQGWELYDTINQLGKVWINDEQYFDKVPLTAWEFYIGNYQPAQKWLQDRKGRKLDFHDVLHYQKIIVALVETDRLMKAIDEVGIVDKTF